MTSHTECFFIRWLLLLLLLLLTHPTVTVTTGGTGNLFDFIVDPPRNKWEVDQTRTSFPFLFSPILLGPRASMVTTSTGIEGVYGDRFYRDRGRQWRQFYWGRARLWLLIPLGQRSRGDSPSSGVEARSSMSRWSLKVSPWAAMGDDEGKKRNFYFLNNEKNNIQIVWKSPEKWRKRGCQSRQKKIILPKNLQKTKNITRYSQATYSQ